MPIDGLTGGKEQDMGYPVASENSAPNILLAEQDAPVFEWAKAIETG